MRQSTIPLKFVGRLSLAAHSVVDDCPDRRLRTGVLMINLTERTAK